MKKKNDFEFYFIIAHKWFHENHMVLNHGKYHYIVIGDNDLSHKIFLHNKEITSSNKTKTFTCSFRQQIYLWFPYFITL